MSDTYLKSHCPKCKAENWFDLGGEDSYDGVQCRLCDHYFLVPDDDFGSYDESIFIVKMNVPFENIGDEFDFERAFRSDINAKWHGMTMSDILEKYGHTQRGTIPLSERNEKHISKIKDYLSRYLDQTDSGWLEKILFSASNKIDWVEAVNLLAHYHPELKDEIECLAKV